METKTIAIGCDHAGFPYKQKVLEILHEEGFTIQNCGTDTTESVDYPDFVHPVAKQIDDGLVDLGIVMCGSGNGVAMTANKYAGVRAAVCWNAELASLARQHNDANVLSIPVRFIDEDTAVAIVRAFLSASFEGGRHQRRVDKIAK
jgi:ribose 5-phosphate isomerase B